MCVLQLTFIHLIKQLLTPRGSPKKLRYLNEIGGGTNAGLQEKIGNKLRSAAKIQQYIYSSYRPLRKLQPDQDRAAGSKRRFLPRVISSPSVPALCDRRRAGATLPCRVERALLSPPGLERPPAPFPLCQAVVQTRK